VAFSDELGAKTEEVLLDGLAGTTGVETVGDLGPGKFDFANGAFVLDVEEEFLNHAWTWGD
jgi:hypothetical protein